MISRILNIIKKVLSPKYTFLLPGKTEVVIFDKFNSHLLDEYLPGKSVSYLAIRGEEYNIPLVFKSLLQKGDIKINYYKNYISKIAPKVVITFQDNNKDFYNLSDPSYKTVFIQNGWRGYYADIFELLEKDNTEGFKVDYMLTFGGAVAEEYSKYIEGTPVKLGAFKNNLIPEFNEEKIPNSLSFISQWHSEGFVMGEKFYEQHEFFTDIEKPILEFLVKYCRENDKRFFIIPRNRPGTENYQKEMDYYIELIGKDNFEYLEFDDLYSSYKALSVSEVALTLDSTLGYESALRKTKTAFFSVRSDLLKIQGLTYGWPAKTGDFGDFWINKADEKLYNDLLDRLFAMSDSKWDNLLKDNDYDQILCHDPGNKKLAEILNKELNLQT